MKKLFYLFVLSLTIVLTSCECRWYDDQREEEHYRKRNSQVIYFGNLSFYEEKLFGTWGCTDIWFGNEQVKEIVISEYGKANVQLQDAVYTDRYNRTYLYKYSGKYITFINQRNERESFQFKVYDYKPGSLWLQDWQGVHEVRLYGICNGY